MSYKDDQRALKAPDEFQKLGATAVPWLEKHGRTLGFGLLAVVLVFGIAAFVSELGKRSEASASQGFGGALKVLERDVNASPTAVTAPGDEPAFKTEQEKDEALVKSLSDFRAANSGKKAAVNAALPLAQALLRQGKPDQALPLIEEYLKGAEATDQLRPAAFEARGYAFEAQGQYDQALAAFDELAKETKTDFLKGMGAYHRGRMLQLKNDKEGAAKVFFELQTSAPDSSASRLAKERLSQLAAAGVAVPTAAAAAAFDAGM